MLKNEDLLGCRYGQIVIESYFDTDKYGKRFLCKCDCGNKIVRHGTLIKANRVHSCGCQRGKWNKGKSHEENAMSHIGEKFNRLKIIGYEQNTRKNQQGYLMLCQCDCGNTTKQQYADLKSGKVKSCGCNQKEQASKTGSTIGLNNFKNNYNWYFIKNEEQVNCRTGYEVIYANYLINNNINFEYEPKCFVLNKESRYTPDFYLIDTDEWIEIKGSFKSGNQELQKEKIQVFKQTHKHKTIYWNDIVSICNLPYKAYKTYFRHADKNKTRIEDYLANSSFYN